MSVNPIGVQHTPLQHVNAAGAVLPPAEPKPTSRDNQLEAIAAVWSAPSATAGIWECGPGEFTADRSNDTEVCYIVSGSGTVVGEDGVSADIAPGSFLVLPKGWRGTWVVRETIRKTFVSVG
jgi:uncharacterized cupin superfamily protein